MKTQDAIDFVIPWVDGSDPEWKAKKKAYIGNDLTDERKERYRDWGILPFWFRAVEKFAPWVRTVWFICDQEPPAWLNSATRKLRIIRHEDFIPEEFRPAFSANPIELNMHRIPGLSEQFVYFNDDTFLLRQVKPSFFFQNGMPRDAALLNPLATDDLRGKNEKTIFTYPLNDTEYLNRDYDFRICVHKNPAKWLNFRYGKSLFRNLLLMIWPRFVGFDNSHLPQAFLKSSFEKAWEQDDDILSETSRHAIRHDRDVNQWLIRYRQLAEGTFYPRKPIKGAFFRLAEETQPWLNVIREQKKPMICLNDGTMSEELFEKRKKELQEVFQTLLPEKSEFEI